LRCTSFLFSISSTVPATVEWTRSETDPPGKWKVVATLNGVNNTSDPPDPLGQSGSFPLSQVLPQYQYPLENVTLFAITVQADLSEGAPFVTQTFRIPVSIGESVTLPSSSSLGSTSTALPSPTSTPGAGSFQGGMHGNGSSTHMHGKGSPKSDPTRIAIIGAVIGSVAILLIVVILSFLWWRNRRRRLQKTYPARFSREKMVREVEPANYTSNILSKHQSMSSDSYYTESSVYSE